MLIVTDLGWIGIGGMFSWWLDELLIDFERGSKSLNAFINEVGGGHNGEAVGWPRLSVVMLVESALNKIIKKWSKIK